MSDHRAHQSSVQVATPPTGSITVASATAIGVGGMMGAGLYTQLGLASTTAGVWLPVAFLVGGAVTIFSRVTTVGYKVRRFHFKGPGKRDP